MRLSKVYMIFVTTFIINYFVKVVDEKCLKFCVLKEVKGFGYLVVSF